MKELKLQQLCIGLIGMIGQLGVEDEQKEDWIDLCISLSKLLFSSDNELQRKGKNSLINLIEQNEGIASNLLQIGLLNRSSETLMINPLSSSQLKSSILPMASSSQISSSSPYSVFVMNILEVLDKVLNCENAVFIKSNKLISVLEKIKTEGNTKEIKRKAKFIQDLIIEEGQNNETETELEKSKNMIINKKQAEDKASASEVRCKALEQEKVQKDEKIKTLNQEKTQKDLKIDALTKEKIISEQKAVQLEGHIKTLEQDRKQLEDKSPATQKENLILMRKMNEISKRMNDHLKSMVFESDLEKLRMIPWIEMCKDLSKPIVPGQEGSIDLQRQIEICQYLIEMFKNQMINDEYRKRCINSGIAKALLNIFENWKLEDIKIEHSKAFFKLTVTDNNEILQLLFALHPFKGLLNLLIHSKNDNQQYAIYSIFNIQLGGANSTSDTEVHPYFDSIASIGGIEKIYEFMNRNNASKYSKDTAAITIGNFYKFRKIENVEMRINVITHLKSIINDDDGWTQEKSRKALRYLSQNLDNKNEIQKDGYVIPK
ncbi:MAG: hypothetical protein EZS28_030755 [Streblomastix strix]|uniref:Uncharacterized protein n=1 Tax=Streblomastix strix TaxID=222440 RepID=A0A5J4UTJ7_9EUKA|nr:MAG: hypothetical protein EZS28_030755 [Streblomastix strix]